MTKFLRSGAVFAVGILFAAGHVSAQDVTAAQTATFEVESFRAISVSGDPGALVITDAEAGGAPTSVTDASTTWAVSTNESNLKLTGEIPLAMPSGVTLSIDLAAPAGAASQGSQALGVAAVDLVTGITEVDASGLTITYTLDATSEAGVVASDSRVVTLTLTAGA
jgi:hypothetical protein